MPMRKPDYIPSWLASDTQVLISPNKAAIGYIKLLTQMHNSLSVALSFNFTGVSTCKKNSIPRKQR